MVRGYTDSHVHFWDRALRDYPWLAAAPAIAGRHGPDDLAREAGADAPARVVFVQADCDRACAAGEVEWVESLARVAVPVAGIVAFAPMDEGAATTRALRALAGRPLVRGVRHLIQDESDPGFCLSDAFVRGVRECGELGLTFDVCIRHSQLPSAVELARLCPGTTLVLDHGGKPDLRSGATAEWRAQVSRMAELPNVVCKVSGLLTEAGPNPDPDTLEAAVGHLVAAFGPSRLLFGSDWPVVKLAAPYADWLRTARSLLADLPDADQSAIFSGTAARIYRLA